MVTENRKPRLDGKPENRVLPNGQKETISPNFYDVVFIVMWKRFFLSNFGIRFKPCQLLTDNCSAIKLKILVA
jgi:hypothetical protein